MILEVTLVEKLLSSFIAFELVVLVVGRPNLSSRGDLLCHLSLKSGVSLTVLSNIFSVKSLHLTELHGSSASYLLNGLQVELLVELFLADDYILKLCILFPL